jgi:hypothetical protein
MTERVGKYEVDGVAVLQQRLKPISTFTPPPENPSKAPSIQAKKP